MYVRLMLIAAAALTSVSAFAAEPAKPAQQQSSQQQPASAQVVLASADDVRAQSPVAQQPTVQPKPHRVARVTTCRCGDLVPQPS
ncbi:MAG TPA: hypothetical protein VE820_10285, partial [Sphingomicrobium sp.]|nr:hypothetical protein [Sphingomicrobium sp.]